MDDVVHRILASVSSASEKHYFLLVGPRGAGKTHFVALAYHRIRDALRTSKHNLEIAFLNEEEWGVASYLDFLVRILRALANDSNNLNQKISSIYDAFASRPFEAESLAERVIVDHVGKGTLLLVCENLVDLFEGLSEVGQKRWRAFIQETGFWTILATTPTLFAAVTLQEHPFYGFFTLRELKRIDCETARDLLARKASHDGQSELVKFLATPVGRARVRAIHHLAAGNHRAYVILYDFLDRESLDDLIDPFMHMVDDLTPYYQDRMRQLPPAQRKIVEFLCQKPGPATVKEVAAGCLMSQQSTAKQVGELALSGFVSRIPQGRQTYCELSEPLMRICIEVKDNRTEHFRLFVEFLRHWFTSREIEQRIGILEKDTHARDMDKVHFREALRCARMDSSQPFVAALREEGRRCFESSDYAGLASIYERLVTDEGSPSDYHWLVYALRNNKNIEEAERVGREAIAKFPRDARLHLDIARVFRHRKDYDKALFSLDEAIAIDPSDSSYPCLRATVLMDLGRYDEAISEARVALRLDPDHLHSYEQIIESLIELERFADAQKEATALLARSPRDPKTLVVVSHLYYAQEDYKRALALLNDALSLDPSSLPARYGRGLSRFELHDYRGAAEDLRALILADSTNVGAYCRLSDSLMNMGDYKEAAEAAQRLIELDPAHDHAYVVLGTALMEIGDREAVPSVLNALLRVSKNAGTLSQGSEIAVRIGDLELADRLLDTAVQVEPQASEPWEGRANRYLKSANFEEAWAAIEKAASLGLTSKVVQRRIAIAQSKAGFLSDALENLFRGYALNKPSSASLDGLAEIIAGVMYASVRLAGPPRLLEGVNVLLRILEGHAQQGAILGRSLTSLLKKVVGQFQGPADQWEVSIRELTSRLVEFRECEIPLAMLAAAMNYVKSQDRRHLLTLPLEQRQLLEEVLTPPAKVH